MVNSKRLKGHARVLCDDMYNTQAMRLKEMFIPFSIGKRNCIGQNLALMELRVILANVVRNFDMELVGGDPELDYFVTLKPVDLRVKVNRR